MNPEPPIGAAMPYASAAPATGPIWSQAASTVGDPRMARTTSAAAGARDDARDEPVPDLLGDEPNSGAVADRARLRLGDRERDEEDRHADARR